MFDAPEDEPAEEGEQAVHKEVNSDIVYLFLQARPTEGANDGAQPFEVAMFGRRFEHGALQPSIVKISA